MNIILPSGVDVLENLLPVAGSSLVACQGLKFLLAVRRYKKRAWQRLLQPGGMPSSHVALVTSLAATMGLLYGWVSPYFQLAAVFGGIVIYDAITLRRAVGEHARRINLLYRKDGFTSDDDLLENMGHTPGEVFIGFVIGLMAALFFFY